MREVVRMVGGMDGVVEVEKRERRERRLWREVGTGKRLW